MWESVSALIPAMLERLQVLAMSRVALVMSGIAGGVALLALICQPVRQALVFSYNCFLQPLGKPGRVKSLAFWHRACTFL